METDRLYSASISPVVLISACGLITLALYNRLGTILGRIRAFHQQKIELLKGFHEHDLDEQQMLLEMLDSQIDDVTHKARLIQKGLYCLLAAICSFLFCSPLAAAAVLQEWFGLAALGMNFLGISLFFFGIVWSMRELTLSLAPLEEESAYLELVTSRYLAKSQVPKPRIAAS